MTLQTIEEIILMTVGADRYADLSTDTDTEKIADFALLHRCVHLARQAIARNVKMLGNVVWDNITVTKGTNTYDLPADFDLPILMVWIGADGLTHDLSQIYAENLIRKMGKPFNLLEEDTPEHYAITGQSSDRIQLALAPTPDQAGTVGMTYYPILANLITSTDEKVDMIKYPETIIKFATAWAFQLLKKDTAGFDKYYAMGQIDLSMIRQREMAADSNMKEIPDSLMRARRMNRYSR